ncbi:hypothetical protein BGW38_004420 [Lunasporangiospora selenospora]|uniref:Uncharacterized protein n=1 Tax=Lunasporangiospora selenospora TaxID=979761 RepID=A0A9P6KC19_9FUNG|nr:hypothetical protein BGW38_004420 [Lunasporangiospora selenospora]
MGILRNAAGSNATNGRKQTMDNIVPAIITEKYLADLNARIKKALRMNDRWTAIWNDLLRNGFLAQDIQENADNPEKKFRSTLRPLNSKRKEWRLSFEWLWHLKLRPVLLRCLSVICAIMSLVIVWSETTYNHVNPILSVIGLLVQVASDRISYGAIEAVSFITMLYMCTCAYNTLLKMKLLSNYVLVPNHHTDEPSLLFFGSYLCRLTFPLVYNYLTISAVGKDDSTEFSRYMGKIDMVPFLGEFNYYMPYVILVPTLITLFNVFAKMFAVCSISDNFFDNDDDEGGIGGDLEEGQQVLKDARRDEERRLMPERQGLNRDFTARRGAAFENYNSNKNKNKNRNRNRNDNMTRGMLGEGSSTSAWRDLRPHPSGTNQRYHDTYYDDHSEDDDEDEDEVGGLGRREPDYYGGGSAAGRSSFDGPGRGGPSSRTPLRPPRQQESAPSSLAGGFKSVWQKFVKPKQPISLDEPSNPDMVDSDGARSSLESTGHDRPSRGTAGRLPNRHQPAAATTVATAASSRSGPALMFASVQQQSPNFSRSPFQGQDDRESLLSVPSNPSRPSHSNSSSRAQSPQGRGASPMLGAGKNSRPNSRVFGTSNPGSQQRTNDPSPRPAAGSRHGSPLINIFDDDDD